MKILLIIFLFIPLSLLSQKLKQEQAVQFIQALLYDSEKVNDFIAKEELQKSNRFGIHYENVNHKFLISYDIDAEIKKGIQNNKLDYSVSINHLSENYSKLVFSIENINYQKAYFFQDDKLISPNTYYCKNWKKIDSKYFKFFISDSNLFNSYCIRNLDDFFVKTATKLNLSQMQVEQIQSQKIFYYLCKDSEEIERITGFNTRGMYNLAYDFVITTFNAHYHELMHLLINYKIGKLPLYTHPFFQEGFAVAIGGRGGKEPKVILNLGLFLYKSNMIEFTDLLSKPDFYNFDASLSYPASGLYNSFLLDKIGIDKYLKLYVQYSGSANKVDKMTIHSDELPLLSSWNNFISEYSKSNPIKFSKFDKNASLVYSTNQVRIYQDFEKYYFQIRDTLLIRIDNFKEDFQSKKFNEICKNRKYEGEKYLVMANTNEISIYNLFTNNLIANYVSSFSIPTSLVPKENEYFQFSVDKYIFEENLKEVFIKYQIF